MGAAPKRASQKPRRPVSGNEGENSEGTMEELLGKGEESRAEKSASISIVQGVLVSIRYHGGVVKSLWGP